jgi:hypothetical protein
MTTKDFEPSNMRDTSGGLDIKFRYLWLGIVSGFIFTSVVLALTLMDDENTAVVSLDGLLNQDDLINTVMTGNTSMVDTTISNDVNFKKGINNTVIGATTPAAGTFTSLTTSSFLFTDTTNSVSTTTGSLVLPGGLGVALDSHFGGSMTVAGPLYLSKAYVGTNSGTNITGANNTAVGINTLASTVGGVANSAFGTDALMNNTGDDNCALGYGTLGQNIGGAKNNAFGRSALAANISGQNNVAFGYQSMVGCVAVNNNVAIGINTLAVDSAGSSTAVGCYSLSSNTAGTCNSALGFYSLASNIAGNFHTAIGFQALTAHNTNSDNNTAVGYQSMVANTSGHSNTAVGYQSLAGNVGSSRSTALGYMIGQSTSVSDSIGIGYGTNGSPAAAGDFKVGSNLNTWISGTYNVAEASALFQVYGSLIPTTDNTVSLGDSTHLWTNVWSTNATIQTSDARKKDYIEDIVLGLNFIERLRPVSYKWKDVHIDETTEIRTESRLKKTNKSRVVTEDIITKEGDVYVKSTVEKTLVTETNVTVDVDIVDGDGNVVGSEKEYVYEDVQIVEKIPAVNQTHIRTHTGLIAQEVKTVLDDLSMSTNDFAGYIDCSLTAAGSDSLGLRYVEFIAPIIKAIQELAEKNRNLQARLQILESNKDIF